MTLPGNAPAFLVWLEGGEVHPTEGLAEALTLLNSSSKQGFIFEPLGLSGVLQILQERPSQSGPISQSRASRGG